MNNQLVSVVIPTYKRQPNMLRRAVTSVLEQTYTNLEILVIDDSPSDYPGRVAIREMLSELGDTRIQYHQHADNFGACVARNTGIDKSKGAFVAFLDDDDAWDQHKLAIQIPLFDRDEVGLVYCRKMTIEGNEQHIDHRTKYKGKVFDQLIYHNFIGSNSMVVVRRSCFEKVGMFVDALESAQDYVMWLKIAEHYEVNYSEEVLTFYYIHDNERISSNPSKKIQGLEMLNVIFRAYLKRHPSAYQLRIYKIIPFYLLNGNKKKALSAYCEGLKKNPFNIRLNGGYLMRLFRKY